MKQIIMEGPRQSRIVEVPMPQMNEDQLLVKVIYTGMCHSEFFPWTVAKKGDVFGHETVGIIEKIGKNVAGFSVGDRVTGLGGGGYKEYIVMEPQKTVKVPENLAPEDAIAEPLACIMSVAERIDSGKIGDRIAVVGCGYMGLGLISLLKARGYADIIAVDKRPIALENAKKFGATETYLPEELPETYKLNWDNWSKPDLTRDIKPTSSTPVSKRLWNLPERRTGWRWRRIWFVHTVPWVLPAIITMGCARSTLS